jgi:hypothetical protein
MAQYSCLPAIHASIQIAVHGQGEPMRTVEFTVPAGVTAETLPHHRKALVGEQSDDLDDVPVYE